MAWFHKNQGYSFRGTYEKDSRGKLQSIDLVHLMTLSIYMYIPNLYTHLVPTYKV